MVSSKTVAATAVFTAFVAAATSVFSVYIPATTGYFNVGEIMVYTAALLMGPYVGGFAGGVGSMLSDLSLGYPYYAPGTLLIKGAEGFIVGYLANKTFAGITKKSWRALTVAIGLAFATALGYIGISFLSGSHPVTLGGAWYLPALTTVFDVPQAFWVGVSAMAFLAILFFGWRAETKSGLSVLSVLVGGSEMVLGYFTYESFILRLIAPASIVSMLAPAAEVPVNVAQVLVGLLISVPLVQSIRRVFGGGQGDRGADVLGR